MAKKARKSVILADGSEVSVPKRYCDKRRMEKKIQSINQSPNLKEKEEKPIRPKETLIPVRMDIKTLVYVRLSKIRGLKWVEHFGGPERLESYISQITDKILKTCQI